MESWAGQLSVAVVGRVRPGVALRPGRAGGEAGGCWPTAHTAQWCNRAGPQCRDTPLVPTQRALN